MEGKPWATTPIRWILVAAALVASSAAIGCGGSDESSAGDDSPATQAAASSKTPEQAVRATYLAYFDMVNEKDFTGLCDLLTANAEKEFGALDCLAGYQKLLGRSQTLESYPKPPMRSVVFKGDTAILTVSGKTVSGAYEYKVRMVEQDDAWKIDDGVVPNIF